jgi:hypothetical protein
MINIMALWGFWEQACIDPYIIDNAEALLYNIILAIWLHGE